MTGPGPLVPGQTLGVFGGGQLGRMFGIAARRLGFRFAVFSDDEGGPGAQIADHAVRGDYRDEDALRAFAERIDAATFEFENVPAVVGEVVSAQVPVRPRGGLLHTVQDRLREKAALVELGLPVAPHHPVIDGTQLEAAAAAIPGAGVLKTSSFGYDGKGQRRVEGGAASLRTAFDDLGGVPSVLEGLVPFEEEISVVAARGADGQVAIYEPFANAHANHILDVTTFPARLPEGARGEALEIARACLEGLDVVGVLCIELFRLGDGSLLVNEIAPRPHNSGHLTIEATPCCQFQMQARAVAGLPLGSTAPTAPGAAMANLLGDLWEGGEPRWADALAIPGVALHLYGKATARPGRKMGHLTALGSSPEEAETRVREARARLAGRSITP